VFYDLNGFDLEPSTVGGAVETVVAAASGQMKLSKLTGRLVRWAHTRPR
jgi:hypothetical protein